MTFLIYFSSYMTVNMVLAALSLMNAISCLLHIDRRVDLLKRLNKMNFLSEYRTRNEDNFKEMREDAIFLRCPNICINKSISFVVGLSQSVLEN